MPESAWAWPFSLSYLGVLGVLGVLVVSSCSVIRISSRVQLHPVYHVLTAAGAHFVGFVGAGQVAEDYDVVIVLYFGGVPARAARYEHLVIIRPDEHAAALDAGEGHLARDPGVVGGVAHLRVGGGRAALGWRRVVVGRAEVGERGRATLGVEQLRAQEAQLHLI